MLTIITNLPNLSAQEKGELLKQIEVKNGAVIIDGKYIEPPYLIEARDNGIWINSVQAEKITKRKEQYKKIKEDRIKNEIYAEYFELGEEIGREKAKEKIINNLMARKSIKGVNLRKAKLKNSDEIEINTEESNSFNLKLEIEPSATTEKHMLEKVINKKYGKWYTSKENKNEAYNDLINFLEIQKQKGRIEAYRFEKDTLVLKITSDLVWTMINSASIEERQLPSNEEANLLDKKDSQDRIEVIAKALNGGYLQVSSRGRISGSLPGGKSIIEELKKIITDKNLTTEQRKEMIKKVYHPAAWEKEFLEEILDNFNK